MKNLALQFLFVITVLVGLAGLPSMTAAQLSGQQSECSALLKQINDYGGGNATSLPAFCNVGTVYTKLTYWMYYIIGIAGVISLIYSGYMYMTARDNESQLKKAKSILIWTIAGIALALIATIIVGAVINLVVENKLT